MNKTPQPNTSDLASRLTRYGCAVGAGALFSPLALADVFDFEPLQDLPIVIDSSTTYANRVLIDLDGDTVDDFGIYFSDTYGPEPYGGGFVITGIYPSYVQSNCCAYNAHAARNDLTEFISASRYGTSFYDFSSGQYYIDATGGGSADAIDYTPFRDNPGFLGLALPGDSYAGEYAGTLKIVVNASGTQLTILKGSYRKDTQDLLLDDGIMMSDGFESSESPYFPSGPLQDLANGSEE